jgi:hypothetical protein
MPDLYQGKLFRIRATRKVPDLTGSGFTTLMDEGTMKTPIPKCRLYWCFCLWWCTNFVGSESGQKESVNSCRILCTTQLDTPPIPPHTHCLYSVHTVRLIWGGAGEVREKVRGATVHKRGQNTNMTDRISSL